MTWFVELVEHFISSALLRVLTIQHCADEAEMAGYRRVKERPDYLIGEIPATGGKIEGGLRSVAVLGPTITAKQKEQ